METRDIFVVFDELALEGADPSPARLRRSGLGRLTRGPEELEQGNRDCLARAFPALRALVVSRVFLDLHPLKIFPLFAVPVPPDNRRREFMKLMALALAAAVSSTASAAFVEFYTVKTQTSNSGVNLDVYVLYARFDGATDTVLNAFNLNGLAGSTMNAFYHKDNSDEDNPGQLSQSVGSWAPQATGSATANRPFDSYLVIGGNPVLANSTNADPSWGAALSWNRADIPNGLNVGWFNSNPPNLQGRVGNTGNTADSVRLGQFVIARDFNAGTFNIKIGYNSGVAGAPVQFAESTFNLPAPGAVALLGLAGLAGRRRR
jgi:hypothetical protein